MNKIFLTLFILLGAIAFGATKAEAATFLLAQGTDGQNLYAVASTKKYDHAPGEEVLGSIRVINESSKINLGKTDGGTNGTWKKILDSGGFFEGRFGYAPSSAGTYAANFETNFTRIDTPTAITAYITPEVAQDPVMSPPSEGYCTGKPVTDNNCYYWTEVAFRVNLSQAATAPVTVQIAHGDLRGSVTVAQGQTQNSVLGVGYYTHFGGTRLPAEGTSSYTYSGFSFVGNGISQYNPYGPITSCSVSTGNASC